MILTDLWTSRIVQKDWSPDIIVWIGRRLVETRFCRGHVDASIQLCRDICYNLRQVWGCCDPITLEMTKLLSGLYTASGNHQAAMTLHETVLYDLLNGRDEVEQTRAADTAMQHIELLKRAHSRLSKDEKNKSKVQNLSAWNSDLVTQVLHKFGLESSTLDISQMHDGSDLGTWHRPRSFSLDVDEQQMHQNHLRRFSGSSSHGRRISIQAL
jgi:hypothetical protein